MGPNLDSLKKPRYFPIEKGVYEVAPGLKPLGTDFGNGALDAKIFQIDSDFVKYRSNKMEARAENLSKYFLTSNLEQNLENHFCLWAGKQLSLEYPEIFSWRISGRKWQLNCQHTHEILEFNENGKFLSTAAYTSGFDAIACQVQEDLALQQLGSDASNWLSALHVCSPAHWSPGDKIGKDFTKVHSPVPGIQKINSSAKSFAEAMVKKGPFVRFVWGFATDDRLNHHPVAPPGANPTLWSGRKFNDPKESKFFLRLERQVTWGFPELMASFFTIRVSFIPGDEIKANPREKELLVSALRGIHPDSLKYKGLHGSVGPLIEWLET